MFTVVTIAIELHAHVCTNHVSNIISTIVSCDPALLILLYIVIANTHHHH